jgi:cupin 2 domain-containing protein
MLRNLYDYPAPSSGERFEKLLESDHLTIETIVSSDTPETTLYDQDHDEAVLLLEGCATLWIDGRTITMKPGDFLLIPAHKPHKVLKTEPETRWLAIHSKEPLC